MVIAFVLNSVGLTSSQRLKFSRTSRCVWKNVKPLYHLTKSSAKAIGTMEPVMALPSSNPSPLFSDEGSKDGEEEDDVRAREQLDDKSNDETIIRELDVDNLTPEVIRQQFDLMIKEAEKNFELNTEKWATAPILNTVILTGRLGRNPELKTVKGDLKVCNFSLAVSRDKPVICDPDQDNLVDWFNVRAFGKLAETVKKFGKKGLRVGIIGRVDFSVWTGRDGATRENAVVTAKTFEVLQSKSEASDFSAGSGSYPNYGGQNSRSHSDLTSGSSNSGDDILEHMPF